MAVFMRRRIPRNPFPSHLTSPHLPFVSFQSAAHSFLRLIIALLLLKNVAWAGRIERRSLYFGNGASILPGIQYAASGSAATGISLTPAVFSHQIYHDYNLQQPLPPTTLGSGSLIPISYGSYGSAAPFYNSHTAAATYNGHSHNSVEEDAEPYYYHGDRILKQYLVSEMSKHDLLVNQHLGNPYNPPPVLRYETRQLPFGGIVDVPVFATNSLDQQLHPFKPSTLRKNHGLIALGSGSLGLISLPNGNVYLGSGSLGYVSEKQHVDTLTKPTAKPFLIAGPLHFGTNEN